MTEEEWYNVCRVQHSTTGSRVWREFGWKNIIRYFITPKIKGRYAPEQNACWRQCGEVGADHTHIFFKCQKMKGYWEEVWGVLKGILGYEVPKTGLMLYLGNLVQENTQGGDRYLIKVLLAASKKTITRAWYKADPPTKEQWLGVVQEIFDMERFTHILRVQEGTFESKWEKWVEYKRKMNDTTN